MYPIIIKLGPIPIYSFGLMMALAFLSAAYFTGLESKRKGYDPEVGSAMVVWAAVGGIVGARLWLIVEDWQGFLADPVGAIFSGAGFVWYGGLFGGALMVGWAARRYYGMSFLTIADCVAPGMAFAHAVGRIGCQLAGDGDWGSVTTVPWGMAYPNAIIGWDYPPGVLVHPTPLYEAAAYFGIFGLMWTLRRRMTATGSAFGWYLLLTSVARFLIEFVRINPRLWLDLSAAQWTAVVLGICGVALLLAAREPAHGAAMATRASGR